MNGVFYWEKYSKIIFTKLLMGLVPSLKEKEYFLSDLVPILSHKKFKKKIKKKGLFNPVQ